MNNKSMTSGVGQFHTNEPGKPNRKPYIAIDFDEIRALVDTPQEVDKAKAQWLIPSSHPSRNFKEQERYGNYLMLWADLDKNPPTLPDLAIIVEALLGGCDFEAYNSRSATADNQKARLLVPLLIPLGFTGWRLAQETLNDKLEALGITPDRANERAAQLCYLPNRGAFYGSESKRGGKHFNPLQAWDSEITARHEALEAERAALETRQKASIAGREALSLSDAPDLIGAFNLAYTPQDWLIKAGYSQRGNTFRHPGSETGNYSATVRPDADGALRVNTLSSSDPLYTGGGAHDAFSTFCTLFHGGDNAPALKDAGANLLAIGGLCYNKAKQVDWAKKKGTAQDSTQGAPKPDGVGKPPKPDFSEAIDPNITPQEESITDASPSMGERPCYRCHAEFWKDHNGKAKSPGIWWHGLTKPTKTEPAQPTDTWICGEMHIEAIARDKAGRSFGQVLMFKNKLNHGQVWNMPTRLLAGRGDELLRELLDMGLAFNYHKRTQIAAYINSVYPDKSIWTASQVGWFEDSNSFVLPNATIGKDAGNILFQAESNTHQEYSAASSLDSWSKEVSALCVGNPLLMFTVSTAFAGALLKHCNMDGVGFHVFGESSRGKTTGLKLAASVWGQWEKYKRVWKATANGLEGAAALFNDGLLTLDEIGDGDPKEISEALYLLGNGSGKQRANVLGNAKAVKTWRVAVLSNGEKTIEAHLAQKGLTMKAGQLVRFLQIPLFGQYGAFDDLHGHPDGRSFADAVVKNATKHYGTAGRHWLDKLTHDPETLAACSGRLDGVLKHFAAQFGELTPQEARAAKAFALVGMAGELVTDYGVTGWGNGAALESALTCFFHWRVYRGSGDTEGLQIRDAITAYIDLYGDARFTSITDDTRLHGERSGYWRDDWEGRQWLFTKAGLQQATRGFDLKQVVGVLRAAGWLMLDSEGKSTKLANFKDNETDSKRFYFIRFSDDECNAEKLGVTGVTATNGTACSSNTCNTSNTEKTDNTTQVRDRGRI